MKVRWTNKSLADLTRLYEFLEPFNSVAARRIIQSLTQAVKKLSENPRIGIQLNEFSPREVRRIIVIKYEIRYEILDDDIYILRLWHSREHR